MSFLFDAQPEQLGSFFIGADLEAPGAEPDHPLQLDARDLTTHGVCVGMTGSGKTGLCVTLLEEAAVDGVPAIIIDPKGDMGNLLLHFPGLDGSAFLPWVNPDDARRKGLSARSFAEQEAAKWSAGLHQWGIGPDRIRSLGAVEFVVFTPGSASVRPINVLGRLEGPEHLSGDELHERSMAIGSALLGLIGVEADPATSRELTFLTVLIESFWQAGSLPDIASVVRAIPDPPVRQFGVFDVDSFFPERERFDFALRFNNLLASPGFSAWLEGPPLDVESLLYSPSGKPRHSIFYLAHLSDKERMFFVTLLLGNLITWMRRQQGTTSLRSLLYFDEVFGFLPPVAQPPSKQPLMTILKQGRAFGLGALLATQNPVDLDYKALSNAGSWFIGRLQSEQDQRRLLDGLGSTGVQPGGQDLASLVAQLEKRDFLLHSVHEEGPILFRSRWAMNYLRGPLSRTQLAQLQVSPPETAPATRPPASIQPQPALAEADHRFKGTKPAPPRDVEEAFLLPQNNAALVSAPFIASLGARTTVRFLDRKRGVDTTSTELLLVSGDSAGLDWERAAVTCPPPALEGSPTPSMRFAGPLPEHANTAKEIARAKRGLSDFLYRNRSLQLMLAPDLDICQRPGESPESFFARVQIAARERRDKELDRLTERYHPKIERLEGRLRKKELDVGERQAALQGRQQEEWIRLGESVLGMVLGGRRPRVSSSASRRRMTAEARKRLERALEEAADIRQEIQELKAKVDEQAKNIRQETSGQGLTHETFHVVPRRTDVSVNFIGIVWHQPLKD